MEVDPSTIAKFQGIKRFAVLKLENRSFGHLFGYLKAGDSKVMGLTGSEFNQEDPNAPGDPAIKVSRASSFVMAFDPGHACYDVKIQLYGPLKDTAASLPPLANLALDTAPMAGVTRLPRCAYQQSPEKCRAKGRRRLYPKSGGQGCFAPRGHF